MSTETTITVTGMTCDHCVRSVRDELSQLDGVSDVDVDLAAGRVRIQSDAPVDDAAVRAAVEEAGYEVSSWSRPPSSPPSGRCWRWCSPPAPG